MVRCDCGTAVQVCTVYIYMAYIDVHVHACSQCCTCTVPSLSLSTVSCCMLHVHVLYTYVISCAFQYTCTTYIVLRYCSNQPPPPPPPHTHTYTVIFQPFFTLTTSRYFKMCYQAASIKLTPPPTRQPPARPPPPRKQQSQPSSQLTMVVRGLHTSKGLSVSQPEINKIGVKHYDNHDDVLSRKKITTSPATGQISSEEHDVSHDSPDGNTHTCIVNIHVRYVLVKVVNNESFFSFF